MASHCDSLASLQGELGKAGNKPVVVDFWASWCGPCRQMAPVFESLARTHKGKAVFLKVDVDKAKDAAQEYGASSLPTFILFHRSTIQQTIKGADADGLTAAVSALVKKHNGKSSLAEFRESDFV
jgi:thioredoxin 1